MNFDSKFKTMVSALNDAQREAVEAIEGPVMVVAGPGTGKTQILTLRIAHIIQATDTPPDSILALTFTENAASNMRVRLASIIGPSAYRVWIGTFHGFCNEIISTYSEYFEDILGRRAASDVEQLTLLQEAITQSDIPLLKPFSEPFFYLKSARSAISHLKREGVSPSNFLRILQTCQRAFEDISDLYHEKGKYAGQMKGVYLQQKKTIEKNFQLQKLYEAYQAQLRLKGLYDFDDMILEVSLALQNNSELLLTLGERFSYIMVDEHQDTNNAQNKVLELLASFSETPNLFVVGDEKQAIFRFQGASLENFLYFQKLYPTAKLIVLSENYRSTQKLLDASTSMIANRARSLSGILPVSAGDVSGALRAASVFESNHDIFLAATSSGEVEAYLVAARVSELINTGVPPSEIAILYRDNRDAEIFSRALSRQHIAHRVISKGNILNDVRIRQLLTLLSVVAYFPADDKMGEVLHFDFFGITPLDIAKIISFRGEGKKLSLMEKITSPILLQGLGVSDEQKILAVGALFLAWKKKSHNATVTELCEDILYQSGFMTRVLADAQSSEIIASVSLFFNEIQKLQTNTPSLSVLELLEHFNLLHEYAIPLSHTPSISGSDKVLLMTAHAAKGLEFDYVFVVAVFDGHWGNRVTRNLITLPSLIRLDGVLPDEPDSDEDERRLFYVAMTRARLGLFLSYARTSSSGASQMQSRFIDEIDSECLRFFDVAPFEESFLLSGGLSGASSDDSFRELSSSVFDIEFIRELFYTTGLSATAVNNFIACPIQYFYVNLLRLPSAKSRSQLYGTAIHAALKDFFDSYAATNISDPAIAFSSFEKHLQRVGLSVRDEDIFLVKGIATLDKYLSHYQSTFSPLLRTEVKVSGVVLDHKEGMVSSPLNRDVPLSGFLDRVDILDTVSNRVRVVDYKTGKPKTRNELEGKTKNADGNYIRQLVFYKLLLDRSRLGFQMESGRIDFVEPNEKGVYFQHDFFISRDDVSDLHLQLYHISSSVVSGDFLKRGCQKNDCEYCALFSQFVFS